MSLLGLIRHMADVERNWFRRVMAGEDAPPLYWTEGEADVEWTGAVADPEVVARAWDDWRGEVGYAERYVNGSGDLGIRGTMGDGKDGSLLREVLVHMIEGVRPPLRPRRPAARADRRPRRGPVVNKRKKKKKKKKKRGGEPYWLRALVLAVVVVGVVLLTGPPVAPGDHRGGRQLALGDEVAADVAHRGRLARHPDPGAVGDRRRAGGVRQLGAERVRVLAVMPS